MASREAPGHCRKVHLDPQVVDLLQLPFQRAIPEQQRAEIKTYRDRLLNSICDWRTQGLMKPEQTQSLSHTNQPDA